MHQLKLKSTYLANIKGKSYTKVKIGIGSTEDDPKIPEYWCQNRSCNYGAGNYQSTFQI